MSLSFTKLFSQVDIEDVSEVGGKNASLGEMIKNLKPKGVLIPEGYIVTASSYRFFLKETGLDNFIKDTLRNLNTRNLDDLIKKGKTIREKVAETDFPLKLREAIKKAHDQAETRFGKDVDFAVRSSATAEDLPGASFAGEHETYLNIRGYENTLKAIKMAMASLFTSRAISYRTDKGFDHMKMALSVGIQKMIRSDLACSGVMFTLDTESGFPNVIIINGSWGLGEMIVQGQVTPDEFLVFKPTLNKPTSKHLYHPLLSKTTGSKLKKMIYADNPPTKTIATTQKEQESFCISDEEILKLASWGALIENHYSKKYGKWTPMDIEWAKDGHDGKLYIVQARPETVQSVKDRSKIQEYIRIEEGEQILTGASVGSKIANGKTRVILDVKDIKQFQKGEILITPITDPDWEPVMKIAAGIITDKGGRTSHAAIVSRELGIPCIVGSEMATSKIKTGDEITIDTTGSEGIVFKGFLKFRIEEHDINKFPRLKTHVMLNIATPDTAFEKSFLPNDGVGLAREEFIIASDIGIHPMALVNYDKLPKDLQSEIDSKTKVFNKKTDFYIEKLASGIAKIAAAFYPKPVILRFSDFKTNEYRSLLGGELFEPKEENQMIGWRGASRYYDPNFAPAFELELKAIKKVRDEFGLENVAVMIPFCRTVEEGKKVIKQMELSGLSRKKSKSLKIYMMCEIPGNVVLADQFLKVFDGMSIGSNDLAQLTLGIDRDGNEKIRSISNENDQAVKSLISEVIKKCKASGKYVGICGQAPSDYPEFTEFLVKEGIESISLNPDTVIKTTFLIYKTEHNL